MSIKTIISYKNVTKKPGGILRIPPSLNNVQVIIPLLIFYKLRFSLFLILREFTLIKPLLLWGTTSNDTIFNRIRSGRSKVIVTAVIIIPGATSIIEAGS